MKRCFDSIRHNRKLLAALVTAVALMVAVGTTYTLISPASTMEIPEEKLLTEDAAVEVTLSSEEQAEVDKTIALIDELPEAEEVELKLAEYENADDMEAYEKYFLEISDQAFGVYVYYQDMTPAQQAQVTNRQKLLDMEWMWSAATYAVTTETTVKYLNKGYVTDNGAILVYGGSVAEMLDGGMSYMYWDAIVVEKNDAGGLYVAQHDTSDEIKTGYRASTEDGFVLLVNDRGSLDVRLNCKVNVNFDYKKAAAGYSSAGYGTVSFTDEAPEAEQPPQLTTVTSADTSRLITMNVYNYGSNINDKYFQNNDYPGFQHPTSTTSASSFTAWNFNFGDWITAEEGHTDVTVKGGTNINATTSEYTANMPISGIMESRLVNGYPHINAGGRSMDYLFTDGVYATQLNEISVNGLFQYDPVTGAYYYNSMDNHAQFDDATDTFVLYDQLITSNAFMYPFGNFLPFNDIRTETTQAVKINSAWIQRVAADAETKYNSTGNIRYSQMAAGIKSFDTLMKTVDASWDYDEVLRQYLKAGNQDYDQLKIQYPEYGTDFIPRLYSIDFDEKTDFFFGMDMSMEFMQPKGGMTGNDGKQPMIYNFTGDDDVLVYIDDVLFLDLSGIHRHVGGKIDFVEGKVYYYQLRPFLGTIGPIDTEPYKVLTFEEILKAAGASTGVLNEKGTFEDYSMHKFNFYYMERGSGSSVCRLNFNFPLVKKNSIAVTKELTGDDAEKNVADTLGNPDFTFQILKEGTDEPFIAQGVEYEIRGADGNPAGTGITGTNGIFRLKAGQTAVFSEIDERAGKYYVRELLDPKVFEQYGSIFVDGTSVTEDRNVVVGSDKFIGADSTVKNISDGSTSFKFNNVMDFDELGSLKIKKILKATGLTDEAFAFEVKLDGELLPEGTEYTVTSKAGDTRKASVETAGIISLSRGETAEIQGIHAGTKYTVKEILASGQEYEVIYGGSNMITAGDAESGFYAEGIITAAHDGTGGVSEETFVRVTNTNGTAVDIPVTKHLTDNNGTHTGPFRFVLVETDAEGNVPEGAAEPMEITLDINDQTGDAAAAFRLVYPADSRLGQYYYKVTETADGSDSLMEYDDSEFKVVVTLAEDADGVLTAEPAIYKNGKEAGGIEFYNTQLYSLDVEKEVPDMEDDNVFLFTVDINTGEDPETAESYKWSRNGAVQEELLSFRPVTVENADGTSAVVKRCLLSVEDGDSIRIYGLPAGTTWTVTEDADKSDGYVTSYEINGQQEQKGRTAGGTIVSGSTGNGVRFVNEPCYMLPETGGSGTAPFYIGGLLMIAAASALTMWQRRKEG